MGEVTSMVERVAKAIEGPHLPVPEGSKYTLEQLRDTRWGIMSNNARARRLMQARAAIEAMREPTDSMIEAGGDYVDKELVILVDGIFNAMIDAAINEQVSG